jgi:hypothetical protein
VHVRLPALCAALLSVSTGCAREHQSVTDRYVEIYRTLHPSVVLFTMQVPADDPKRKGAFDEAYGSGFVCKICTRARRRGERRR